MLQSREEGRFWTSPVCAVSLMGVVFWALGAMNGNPIKLSNIWRSGLRFLSNCHSNRAVMGRAWLLPLARLLAELSITVFLKWAWSWIKCDRYMTWFLRDHLKGSRPEETAGLLRSKAGKGIRTCTSTNVMVPLEAKQVKIKLLCKLGSHDVSTYLCRKVRHCLSGTFCTEALRIYLGNIGGICGPVSNPGNSCVVLPELWQASTWRNTQEVG